MWHMWKTGHVCRGFWWRDMRERGHLEDIRVDGRIILIWIFKEWDRKAWIGMICARIGTGGGL